MRDIAIFLSILALMVFSFFIGYGQNGRLRSGRKNFSGVTKRR